MAAAQDGNTPAAPAAETVCILGASGGLGLQLVREGIARGRSLVLIVRDGAKLQALLHDAGLVTDPRISVVPADVLASPDSAEGSRVKDALRPCTVVMSALGSPIWKEAFTMSTAAKNVVQHFKELWQEEGGRVQRRYMACSSWASGANFEPHDGFLYRYVFVPWLIFQPLMDHRRAEQALAALHADAAPASFSWVAVRPPGLINTPRTARPVRAVPDVYSLPDVPHTIARADVARFFFDLLDQPARQPLWGRCVAIAYDGGE